MNTLETLSWGRRGNWAKISTFSELDSIEEIHVPAGYVISVLSTLSLIEASPQECHSPWTDDFLESCSAVALLNSDSSEMSEYPAVTDDVWAIQVTSAMSFKGLVVNHVVRDSVIIFQCCKCQNKVWLNTLQYLINIIDQIFNIIKTLNHIILQWYDTFHVRWILLRWFYFFLLFLVTKCKLWLPKHCF